MSYLTWIGFAIVGLWTWFMWGGDATVNEWLDRRAARRKTAKTEEDRS